MVVTAGRIPAGTDSPRKFAGIRFRQAGEQCRTDSSRYDPSPDPNTIAFKIAIEYCNADSARNINSASNTDRATNTVPGARLAYTIAGRGNYAMGLREHIVFPEINYDQIDQVWGMDIIVTTTAKTDEEARELLREFQFPFTA